MIRIDLTRAKSIAHDRRRAKRDAEFAPWDKVIALQIPGEQANAAEAEREKIRLKYAGVQTSIDGAQSVDELKAILDAM